MGWPSKRKDNDIIKRNYYYYIRGSRVFSRCKDVAKDRNTRGTRIPCTPVYSTQYTSRMKTVRVKQEVGEDTRIIVKEGT